MATAGGGITISHWRPSLDGAESILADVRSLAKQHRKTLGFLPDAAFKDAADAGHLALAYQGGTLVGYTLYRVTKSVIKLTHVCVDPRARGAQVGRNLIEAAIAATPSATGIVARCRRDYDLKRFWEGAGLVPSAEAAGRNAAGIPLTLWTRSLGAPDLLTSLVLDSGNPVAVLDSNVVIDLHSSEHVDRPDREASRALLADWLGEEVTFAVSVQLDHELDDNDDSTERVRQSAGSQGWVRLPTVRPYDTEVEDELLALFGDDVLAKDPSLASDVKHIADAIRATAKYFVTNDKGLIAVGDRIRDHYGVLVLRPHELITDVLEKTGALQSYAPGVFEHIDLRWLPPNQFPDQDLEGAFLAYGEGEKASDFRPSLRAALANVGTKVLVDQDGRPLAIVDARAEADDLRVPLLRVARSLNELSIALQLARQLRLDAVDVGAKQVRVTDPALPRKLVSALRDDGYERDPGGSFAARPIAQRVSAIDLDLGTLLGNAQGSAEQSLGPGYWRTLEWRHWPLKIWDEEAACYVVPIRPSAAMELFAYPPNLLQQRRVLGLSRSHVYYRSGRSNPFRQLPARVLWYASTERGKAVQEFFAVSRAILSEVMPAEDAHARFSSRGVFKRSQVAGVADERGRVTVLQVEDTEILAKPIALRDFRVRAAPLGVAAEFVSPRAIPAELFHMLMTEFNNIEAA